MIAMWIAIYLMIGVVVAALAPVTVNALTTREDKQATEDVNRLGVVALLWPVAVTAAAVVLLVRSLGYLGHEIPLWLGAAARWVRVESTVWTTTKETPTNEQPENTA